MALRPTRRRATWLLRSGLIFVDGSDGEIRLIDRLTRIVHAPRDGDLDPKRLLFDAAPASELEWSDFDHIGPVRDHVESLVRGALGSRQPGVNVLVYGPPGTGKTEFCKVLARRLGVTLFVAGEADETGSEPDRKHRLQELQVAQSVLGGESFPAPVRRQAAPRAAAAL